MNRYPLWKYLLILMVIAFGVVYSIPMLYQPDPAVQITPASSGLAIDEGLQEDMLAKLEASGIQVKLDSTVELNNRSAIIRLADDDEQLPAKSALQDLLGNDWVVALNKVPTTPDWLTALGARPMSLGLDLSGGVHFLMEVDTEAYLNTRQADNVSAIKRDLRGERIGYRLVDADPDTARVIWLGFRDNEALRDGERYLERNYEQFTIDRTDYNDMPGLRLSLSDQEVANIEEEAVKQNLTTISNRVNELGVAEPIVQQQGTNRLLIQLPGVQDTAQAKKVIGRAANLEFRMEAQPGASSATSETFRYMNAARTAKLERDIIITGDVVTNASVSFDENNQPQVNITLSSAGGARMNQATRGNIGRRMGTLFVEQKTRVERTVVDGEVVETTERETTKEIISLATVQSALNSSFRITGVGDINEANELALLLRAGSLAAPMYFVEERTIGPSLGAENIRIGINSLILGMALVVGFMLIKYRAFGAFATVSLCVNILLIVALMSIIGATLTLPGIAGIVLTVGMAVDANVLIFTRIKEELNKGALPQSAIKAGFERAVVTIVDANVTTLIVAAILFAVGTGAVQGFAVTLAFGITTSMFTAIMLTRALTNLVYGRRNVEKLAI
ncbi:protein translocase subunit SecD [Salinibius halmophilus]|uniref:protein translocase subunit SecD n=1 Tax=Salinibius halmophilus TaxID=1853216 RepID=UPI000E66DB40|nr:protein translocase subunit SecD [Salinibius halmophilus]